MKQSKRSDRNSAARFFKNQHLAYPFSDTPRQSRKFVRAMKRLDEIIPPTTQFNKLFLDLLRKIFVYDPKKRITARGMLEHPWWHSEPKPTRKQDLPRKGGAGADDKMGADLKRRPGVIDDDRGSKVARKLDFGGMK